MPVATDIFADRIAQAIMSFEGYFQGSRSFVNHNPGNLKYNRQPGAYNKDPDGHAVFISFEDGYVALINLIKGWWRGKSTDTYHPDMTLEQVFAKYAEGNSKEYAKFVAWRLGVEPTTKLKDL